MMPICRRVAPIARRMPICLRRCVIVIRKVLAMMNMATISEKPRAISMPCCVESEVSSAIALRAAGRSTARPSGRIF